MKSLQNVHGKLSEKFILMAKKFKSHASFFLITQFLKSALRTSDISYRRLRFSRKKIIQFLINVCLLLLCCFRVKNIYPNPFSGAITEYWSKYFVK